MITRLFISYIIDETKKMPATQQMEMMSEFRVALKILGKKKKEVKDSVLLQNFASVIRAKVVPVFDEFPLSFFSLPFLEKQSLLKEKISQLIALNAEKSIKIIQTYLP